MTDLRSKDATSAMLSAVFGAAVEEGYLFHVCSRSNFAGRWFGDIEQGAAAAYKLAKSECVWCSVAVRETATESSKRGEADTVGGILGMWADIDTVHAVHKKQNLPPDTTHAIGLINAAFFSLPPTMIIDSGHGVQAWWLLSEPLFFGTDQERSDAAKLCVRFAATLKIAAKEKGWGVDSVFDLARVLRVAGTVNWKDQANPKPVKIITHDDARRYSMEDFEAVVVAEEYMPAEYGGPKPLESVGRLVLRPTASPPSTKFGALMGNVEEARLSFENKRTDFVDQSPSSYDMSLAMYAAKANWSDQEIADLLIAHRRDRGHELKTSGRGLLRQDYYQRTIAKARTAIGRETVTADLNAGAGNAPTTHGATVTAAERERIIRDASYIFGVPIKRFVQFGDGEDAPYILELESGDSITIGNARNLENQKTWRAKLFPVTRRMFEPVKPKGWIALINNLGLVVEVEDNRESSRHEQISDLLTSYLQHNLVKNEEDLPNAIRAGSPFIRGGEVHVSRQSFDQWLKATQSQRVEIGDVWGSLRRLGFEQRTIRTQVLKKNLARRYWVSPLDTCGEAIGMTEARTDTHEPKGV